MFEDAKRMLEMLWEELHISQRERDLFGRSFFYPYSSSNSDAVGAEVTRLLELRHLSHAAFRSVELREVLLSHLIKLLRQTQRVGAAGRDYDYMQGLAGELYPLLERLRTVSVDVCSQVSVWRAELVGDKGVGPQPFLFRGVNYLVKMQTDLDFLYNCCMSSIITHDMHNLKSNPFLVDKTPAAVDPYSSSAGGAPDSPLAAMSPTSQYALELQRRCSPKPMDSWVMSNSRATSAKMKGLDLSTHTVTGGGRYSAAKHKRASSVPTDLGAKISSGAAKRLVNIERRKAEAREVAAGKLAGIMEEDEERQRERQRAASKPPPGGVLPSMDSGMIHGPSTKYQKGGPAFRRPDPLNSSSILHQSASTGKLPGLIHDLTSVTHAAVHLKRSSSCLNGLVHNNSVESLIGLDSQLSVSSSMESRSRKHPAPIRTLPPIPVLHTLDSAFQTRIVAAEALVAGEQRFLNQARMRNDKAACAARIQATFRGMRTRRCFLEARALEHGNAVLVRKHMQEDEERIAAMVARKNAADSLKENEKVLTYEFGKVHLVKEKANKYAERLFRKWDTNGDGQIDLEELQQLMIGFGHKLTSEEADAVVRVVSVSETHVISFEEFCAWFCRCRNILGILEELQNLHSVGANQGMVDIVMAKHAGDSLEKMEKRRSANHSPAKGAVADKSESAGEPAEGGAVAAESGGAEPAVDQPLAPAVA